MGWISTFLAFRVVGVTAPADRSDATVGNGVRNDAHESTRTGTEDPVGRPEAQIPEEIKRRQIALITRYVTTACTH